MGNIDKNLNFSNYSRWRIQDIIRILQTDGKAFYCKINSRKCLMTVWAFYAVASQMKPFDQIPGGSEKDK